jgi:hypothetical protein
LFGTAATARPQTREVRADRRLRVRVLDAGHLRFVTYWTVCLELVQAPACPNMVRCRHKFEHPQDMETGGWRIGLARVKPRTLRHTGRPGQCKPTRGRRLQRPVVFCAFPRG